MPTRSADEALSALRKALATDLAARRHLLQRDWRELVSRSREARLNGAIHRLLDCVPPPSGRGAVGVDLEGRTTLVEGRASGLFWGPPEALEPVWTEDSGFYPRAARLLLRGRAAAPPNPRLQTEVDGDEQFTEAACRWVAAGLRLRTLSLLLTTSPEENWEIAS